MYSSNPGGTVEFFGLKLRADISCLLGVIARYRLEQSDCSLFQFGVHIFANSSPLCTHGRIRTDTAFRVSDVNGKRSGTKEQQQHALPFPVSVHREVGPTYRCCDEVVRMTLEAGPARFTVWRLSVRFVGWTATIGRQ